MERRIEMKLMNPRIAPILALASALAGGAAVAQISSPGVAAPVLDEADRSADVTLSEALAGQDARVSQLIGKRVTSPAGADLGEIEDLLAATESDNEPTVIISVGGVLDVGDKWYAATFEDLTLAGNDALMLDRTEDELAQEPPFDYLPRAGERSHQPGITGPGTSNSVGSLLGATVVDERGESIGEIDDLVVSSSREHGLRAIVELDAGAGDFADERLVAIPFDELVVEASGEEARGLPQQPRVRASFEDTPIDALPAYEYPSREVI
jgi:sporulation protein YlmC with PRC-barrel domain